MPKDGEHADQFVRRHIGISEADLAEVLRALNVASLDELMDQTVPRDIQLTRPLDLPPAVSEHKLLAELEQIAGRNQLCRSFIGMGYADCITPKVLLRNILQNPGWYTAYTPYQAEISQGRLEALLNFQTMVIDLTGLGVANASLLDEATAAAEAMAMLFSIAEHDRSKAFFVSTTCHPQTIEVLRTRAEPLGIDVIVGDHREWLESRLQPANIGTSASNQPAKAGTPTRPIFGAFVQYPATDGAVYDYRSFCERAHAEGALVVAAADLLSLTMLQPPGEWGADVAVGNSQRFGVPLGYGGPHAAYFATRNEYVRKMPGRLIGVAQDAHGRPALRMALQTREQHIRREKATSNICTAQVLLAVAAGMYAVYHGPHGLQAIAERVHGLAATLAAGLRRLGVRIRHAIFFDTLCVDGTPSQIAGWHAAARTRRMNFRAISERSLGISLDETTGPGDVQEILAVFAQDGTSHAAGCSDATAGCTSASTLPSDASTQYSVLSTEPTSDTTVPREVSVPSPHVSSAGGRGSGRAAAPHFHHDADLASRTSRVESSGPADPAGDSIPTALRRTSPYLTHAVFNRYHSETEMLRYLKSLENRDFSLTHGMIPLGSCTMKLNATAEMIPVTWPLFNRLHPFAPTDQAAGYQIIFQDLERWLAEITGLPGVSLQPNAGSQGEYAGLLVIRRFHASRGQGQRNVCLIPASAHGTNPASAVMAGCNVVVVACDERGNIDLADLEAKARQHRDGLAALMVTYPSTYGVFEEEIRRICSVVHEHGGQVYLDGANMNAQVGLCRPGDYGADVCHLNLHKTFCIPHGGGGPGMGPIAVAANLAEFLPRHPVGVPPLGGAGVPPSGGEGGPAKAGTPTVGPVSAAPWGSASILLISWAYIKLMGADGLTRASQVAILNANYVAERLHEHYPVLYRGRLGRVAHECIIDPRPLKKSAGIEVEDIAKRLMDYGFHAPTISFPVPGTMMIEPTESESKAELDRFCEAMLAIRQEIREIEQGKTPRDDNLLKNAPHTAETVTASEWTKPYSREQAAFPTPATRRTKFWPSVGRINNALGDRNLICACPPPTDYE